MMGPKHELRESDGAWHDVLPWDWNPYPAEEEESDHYAPSSTEIDRGDVDPFAASPDEATF